MANTFTNKDDIIDSRDIIARIEELESEIESAEEDGEEPDADSVEELSILQALADEASGYAADWEYGETLIRDDYFEDYAQELAEDIGAIDRNANWPLNCIDWEQAARELKHDYTAVDFDGVRYWIR